MSAGAFLNGGPVLPDGSAPVAFVEDTVGEAGPPPGDAPMLDLDVLPGMARRRKKTAKQPIAGLRSCSIVRLLASRQGRC